VQCHEGLLYGYEKTGWKSDAQRVVNAAVGAQPEGRTQSFYKTVVSQVVLQLQHMGIWWQTQLTDGQLTWPNQRFSQQQQPNTEALSDPTKRPTFVRDQHRHCIPACQAAVAAGEWLQSCFRHSTPLCRPCLQPAL